MNVRVTRTIEYEYESLEDMAADLTCWTLRTGWSRASSRTWFNFGPKRRARSRIESVVITEGETTHVVNEAEPTPDQQCGCGHPESHHRETRSLVTDGYCDHFICDCQGFIPDWAVTA